MKNQLYLLLFSLLVMTTLISACQNQPAGKETTPAAINKKWWKEAVVYQIYPRSFKDSDGDGVGDLRGIISKLDYLKSLGVDVIWLNPIYASPNDDNGYDISDYRAIMPEMGTMEDFDTLLQGMHERGIKLVMDLVVNHSSDEHMWFKESRSSRDNPYRDYYHWWPAEKGTPSKRWSFFDEESNAWRYDTATNAYYLHYFSRKQPDLNWENPKVRQEVYDLMKFWFDKGVDGFRMDVIPFISKDTLFPELPAEYNGNYVAYYAKGPRLHEYLQEMNREVLSKYDVMTVGEGAGVAIDDALLFVDEDRNELQTFFHFEVADWGRRKSDFMYPDPDNRHLPDLKATFDKWDKVFENKGWGTVYLGNHDQSRMVSRYGNDSPEYRDRSSQMLQTMLLTMRATPYIYHGDEIGMSNIRFTDIKDYRDLQTINYYNRLKKEGGDLAAFMAAQAEVSRDNGRTPIQWDATANAGFTTGKPWIKVNPNYSAVNVEVQEKDPNSTLNYFRKMIALRKQEPALVYGTFTLVDRENPSVFAYIRVMDGRKLLVLLNFTAEEAEVNTGIDLSNSKVLIGNYPTPSANGSLMPYEAVVLEVN